MHVSEALTTRSKPYLKFPPNQCYKWFSRGIISLRSCGSSLYIYKQTTWEEYGGIEYGTMRGDYAGGRQV